MRYLRPISFIIIALCTTVIAYSEEPAPAPAAAAPVAPPPLKPIDQVQLEVWIGETNAQGLKDIGANLKYKRFIREEEQSGSVQQVNSNVADLANPLHSVVLPAPDMTDPVHPSDVFPAPMRPDRAGNASDGIQTQGGIGLQADIISSTNGTVNGVIRGIQRPSDPDLYSNP